MQPPKNEIAHPLSIHRVMDDKKVLPQAAQVLNPEAPIYANELLIGVEVLQIDSASFAQLKSVAENADDIDKKIRCIVESRGKMQNPVTGSGGMLLGRVLQKGTSYPDDDIREGD